MGKKLKRRNLHKEANSSVLLEGQVKRGEREGEERG